MVGSISANGSRDLIFKESTYLKLFASCIPVKGARRSIICDLSNETYYFIPNALFEILALLKQKPFLIVKETIPIQFEAVWDEYIDFLFEKKVCFITDEPELFPEIESNWKSPNIITNAILDINRNSKHKYELVARKLDSVGCIALQIRFYYSPEIEFIDFILQSFIDCRIRSIEILLRFDIRYAELELMALVTKHFRVTDFILTSSHEEKSLSISDKSRGNCIFYVKGDFNSHEYCGAISMRDFRVNLPMVSEAKSFNSCLNRKIGIDTEGLVKNCPSSTQSFGQIEEIDLKELPSNAIFQSVWSVTKDFVEVCMDCEFRYICTDCRVFTKNGKDNSKPLKCTYNPYTAEWK
ncbi:MAG: grasp-with-spasm system SPASM domain peptide maturase [Bacteroidota bacterium]